MTNASMETNERDEQLEANEQAISTKRSLVLFLGFALLGAAVVVLLFADDIFSETLFGQEPAALEQVPASAGTTVVAQPSGTSDRPEVGEPAPNFTLADLEGNEVSLADFRGQPVIINFWATWCGPCRIEMPELQRTFEERQEDGLAILAVNLQESPEMARRFFYDDLGLTFTPLLDTEGEVANRYGVFNLPTTFFVNPEGTITVVHRGLLTEGQIDGYMQETVPAQG